MCLIRQRGKTSVFTQTLTHGASFADSAAARRRCREFSRFFAQPLRFAALAQHVEQLRAMLQIVGQFPDAFGPAGLPYFSRARQFRDGFEIPSAALFHMRRGFVRDGQASPFFLRNVPIASDSSSRARA